MFSLIRKNPIPLFLALIIAAALPSAPALAGETIVIGGTGSALGSMKLIAAAFEKSHPGVQVRIMPSLGSSGAIKAVSKGALGLGLTSRSLKNDELRLGLSAVEYARTPFIPVAHRNVPASGVSTAEVVDIYKSHLLSWSNGERIRLIIRPATETDTALVRSISPAMSAAVDVALLREGLLMALTDQDSVEMLESTPGSFGFSTLAQIVSEKRQLKILSFNGLQPGKTTLERSAYPLAKTLSIVTRTSPAAPVRQFVDFLFSAKGKRILEDSGNIAVPRSAGGLH